MGFAAPMMMLAGTGMQALSAYRQGQYASMQAKAQAGLSMHDAMAAEATGTAIQQKSIFDQIRTLELGAIQRGKIRVGQTEENIWRAAAEQDRQTAMTVALKGYEGITGKWQQETKARMLRNQATYQLATAKNLKQAGTMGAITTGLSGLGNYFLLTGFGNTGGADTSTSTAGYGGAPTGGAYSYGYGQQWRSRLYKP